MVFLRSLIKESGPSVDCLGLFEDGAIELFISDVLLDELSDVLTRPKLQRKYPLLTTERADRLINSLRERATLIELIPSLFTYQRDPKDEPYINLALATGAAYLVSDDNDLLDLMNETDFAKNFRAKFPDVKIVNPVVFIRELSE